MTGACPNLEELHLGRRLSCHSQAIFLHEEPDETAYKTIVNCKKLKKLTISGVEFTGGQFLKQVNSIFSFFFVTSQVFYYLSL